MQLKSIVLSSHSHFEELLLLVHLLCLFSVHSQSIVGSISICLMVWSRQEVNHQIRILLVPMEWRGVSLEEEEEEKALLSFYRS